MPIVRLHVNCGWCGQDATITNGNPDLATTAADTPFRYHDRGVLFVCPHCNAPHLIPVNWNAGPLPKVKYDSTRNDSTST